MQCHGSLKRPLRNIIKAIGTPAHAAQCRTISARPTTLHIDSNTAIDQSDQPYLRTHYGSHTAQLSASGTLPVQRDRPLHRSNTARATCPACRRYTTIAAALAIAPDTTTGRPYAPFPSSGETSSEGEFQGAAQIEDTVEPALDQQSARAPEDNYFEHMIEEASVAELDIKIGEAVSRHYYRRQYRQELVKRRKEALAQKRLKARDAGLWRRILLALDAASSSDAKDWGKRSKVYKLPQGVCASFVDAESTALLEIMLRTKCHVQITQDLKLESDPHSFTGLVLMGTKAETRDALALIPKMVRISHNGKTVEEGSSDQYSLRSEELENEDSPSLDDKEPAESTSFESSSSSQAAHAPEKEVNGQTAPEKTTVSMGTEAMTGAEVATENPFDSSHTPVKPSAADHDAITVRSVWAEERSRVRPDTAVLFDTHHTSIRTAADFRAYVGDIVARHPTLKLRNMSDEKLPDGAKEQFDPIRDKLVTLLTEPSMIPLITPEALENAWKYLLKSENLASIRLIYSALDEAGYKFTSTNFDVLLNRAARAHDIHNFEYNMALMRRKRLQPTAGTWVAAHELVFRKFPKYSDRLIDIMRQKGIFSDTKAVLAVLKTTAETQIAAHLATGRDIQAFFDAQDKRMASSFDRPQFNWLQIDIVNSLLKIILSAGRTDAVRPLLRKFAEEGVNQGAPNVTTMGIFLTMALRDRDARAAVAVLKWCRVGQPGAIVPDEHVYRILFSVAWHKRYYNMLRVIWRYACVAGHADHLLRQRIRQSSILYAPVIESGIAQVQTTQLWQPWAGKFAVGVASDVRSASKRATAREHHTSNVILADYASQEKLEPGSSEFEARLTALKNAYEADLKEVGSLHPVEHLPDILDRAYQKDREWKERGLGVGAELKERDLRNMFAEMLEDGIKVPMTAGDFSRETRKWALSGDMAKYSRERR
ncbi:hypothetical protein HII31_07519 [Pseudocercospora fuligena]|uniref:Uncharacterized protein n=1 Tax=Pseudocercospora fuligena TaxID=685502 RepID=A0A8H6VKA6_9PEZI|nr:hypothetical protein HII31_07519 [Pseudocercospora fuligena]